MDSTTKIIELASQNNGIVTAAMISSAGISRGSLKYLADTGRLDQVSRGVYTLPEVWEDEFVSIQERYKRGVFALDTALFLHDLTDRTPHKFHMAFPYGYNTSSPKAAGILCSCKKEPYYSLGIALVDTPAGNTVRAYNAEKTLCEILKPISHTDIQIITDAFKRYAGRKDKNIPLLREKLVETGKKVELFDGVSKWFSRINNFGKKLGVCVEHYVISSGLKEIIEGTDIANEFKSIFACEFLYDENGNGIWPKTDVNYTNKTQFVYRINKGVLDVANDNDLNKSMPDDSKRIPFCNMIYIGDGLSDVPCMKMMKAYGGYSIAVYQKKDAKVEDLLQRGRVDYIYPADYSENSGLDNTVKNIIQKMAISETLYLEYSKQKHEINN